MYHHIITTHHHYISFRDPKWILDERDLYQVSNSTWKSELLPYRPTGTMDWPSAAFLFVALWVALQGWGFKFWRTIGSATEIKIKIDVCTAVSLSVWQLLGISAQSGYDSHLFAALPLSVVRSPVRSHFSRARCSACMLTKIFHSWIWPWESYCT